MQECSIPSQDDLQEERHLGDVPHRVKQENVTEECDIGIQEKREIGIQCDMAPFSYEGSQSWTDSDFLYFTGISKEAFNILYELVDGDKNKTMKYRPDAHTPSREVFSTVSMKTKLFITLVRLRRGFSLRDLKLMFNLHESQISNIFTAWVRIMSETFKSMEEALFAKVSTQEENKPDCYSPFPNLRCVVDSTDVKIQKPSDMGQQANTFSQYKAHNIVKFLIATSLYGGLSFISEGMEGNISDRQIFLRSGIMQHLNAGEAIMTDRGFDIENDLNDIEVDLLIPPFLGGRDAFTPREVLISKAIASSRIHVETFIGRVKFFKFIRYVVPNTMVDILSDIVRVCACLVNFGEPFIRWKAKKKNKETLKLLSELQAV